MENKKNLAKNENTRKIPAARQHSKSIEALCKEYRRLMKQFEALNQNGAYDAVIEHLLNKLEQLKKQSPK